eukprot:CAMPEP_0197313288 /NCGR_PEP_ID=MMETSP0891-20130614/26290_1 /TAXON_ID=44058 ORGANISM="Aureoumbra lagunensis, Strain CCMP1510" /NCGR_SAMPLE_ID=MMETSP0891 /ASSEMBLY_ACC=CAM_ASM_000534 /LENGTH=543 /DNA_ID=CAMNT_0042801011 /DNA_START=120 /DNA_END=1751 /DNA_ORIENTATION=-
MAEYLDEEMMREVDAMKEFLSEDDTQEDEEDDTAKIMKKKDSLREDLDEFAAAAAAIDEKENGKDWIASAEEEEWAEDAVSLSGPRRRRMEESPSEKAVEQVRFELEQLEENTNDLPSDALQFLSISETVRELDDANAVVASGFLHHSNGQHSNTNSISKASAYGLYEPTQLSSTPPRISSQAQHQLQQQKEDEGEPITYKEFLARLMLPQSAELVSHVRAFVVRILEEAREREDALRARKPGAAKARKLALEALPSRCVKFFNAAQAHMEEHPSWRHLGYLGLASARAALEKYVLSKMGNWAFEACRDDEKDEILATRCRALATFIQPKHLDIKPGLCDNEVVLRIACDELKRIDALLAPSDKVECVVRCASIIFSALNLSRVKPAEIIEEDDHASHDDPTSANGNTTTKKKKSRVVAESRAGADDFLPVFIYVVLHADAPRLYSNCDFVQAFHNPAALMSKAGYCFVNLRSAVEFLLHVSHDQLGMEKQEFYDKFVAGLKSIGGDPSLADVVSSLSSFHDDEEDHATSRPTNKKNTEEEAH